MHYREFITMHGYKLINIIENEAILEGFKSPEVRKIIKTRKISTLGFQCAAISIEGYFKFLISYGVYSQIWLNLLGVIAIFFTSSYG